MPPFISADGGPSQVDRALACFTGQDSGVVVTYDTLFDVTGLSDRRRLSSVIVDVKARLLVADRHTLVAVPNVGYRVTDALGNVGVAEDHRRRATRSSRRVRRTVTATDRHALLGNDDALRRLDQLEGWSARVDQAMRRQGRRLANLERLRSDDAVRAAADREQVEALRGDLERLIDRLSHG